MKEFSYRSKHDLAAVAAAMAAVAVTVFKLSCGHSYCNSFAKVAAAAMGARWLGLAWLRPAATVTVALWLWLRSKLQYFCEGGLAAATAELQRVCPHPSPDRGSGPRPYAPGQSYDEKRKKTSTMAVPVAP